VNNSFYEMVNQLFEKTLRFVANVMINPIASMADKLVQTTKICSSLPTQWQRLSHHMHATARIQSCSSSLENIKTNRTKQIVWTRTQYPFYLPHYLEPFVAVRWRTGRSTDLYLLQLPERYRKPPKELFR